MFRTLLGLALAAASLCEPAAADAFSGPLPLRTAARGALGKLAMSTEVLQALPTSRLRGGESALAAKLTELGQGHLLEGLSEEKQSVLLAQAEELNQQLPGGLDGYVTSARKLLQDSKDGVNPFQGLTPSVPTGQTLDPSTDEFLEMEAAGLGVVGETGFILVAGGLGERLGYNGIKVALPLYDSEREKCFLALYCGHLLQLQASYGNGRRLPLAIMTSDDTHALTEALLKDNGYFGLEPDQVTIMKQNKVPALEDSTARFACKDGVITTKPHGHGDVHTLMHQTGLAGQWATSGVKWIVFFQDTNGIIFRALPSVLGVSATHDFAVNSVCVPRTPGEAVGGICRLERSDGHQVTVNVEYNQLDPLLKSSEAFPDGDVADDTGFSPFPGNINILVMKLDVYRATLQETGGRVNEFVNPKYVDESKTSFKSPTRLECMMQDFPLLLAPDAKVGFTTLPRSMCFSPVKNNVVDAGKKQAAGLPIECAGSAECDAYRLNARLLELAGAEVATSHTVATYAGISLEFPPLVTLLPSFGTSLSDIKQRIKPGAVVRISGRSSLLLDGDIDIVGTLDLDGALEVRAAAGTKVIIKKLEVRNKGWQIEASGDSDDPVTSMRGFTIVKHESKIVSAAGVAEHVIDE